jgi:hypothetical protein
MRKKWELSLTALSQETQDIVATSPPIKKIPPTPSAFTVFTRLMDAIETTRRDDEEIEIPFL